MDRFQEMQVFVRIAERQSFSRASDDLRIPRATVTNLMKRMEARLGARLLERTTRTVRLTQDGEAYYRRCVRLIADLEEAEGAFRAAAPRGLLRVNLQGTLARYFVVPALPDFLARYPGIRLHIGEDDRFVDLVREGVDCVLRSGNLQDSSMVGRRVAQLEQVTVASPGYLARHGEPAELAALAAHRAVDYVSSATGKPMPLEFTVDGRVTEVRLDAAISVAGVELYTGAAVAGLGIVQVPRYRIADELADGRLRIVLGAYPPPPMPVSVLYPHSRQFVVARAGVRAVAAGAVRRGAGGGGRRRVRRAGLFGFRRARAVAGSVGTGESVAIAAAASLDSSSLSRTRPMRGARDENDRTDRRDELGIVGRILSADQPAEDGAPRRASQCAQHHGHRLPRRDRDAAARGPPGRTGAAGAAGGAASRGGRRRFHPALHARCTRPRPRSRPRGPCRSCTSSFRPRRRSRRVARGGS